MTLQQADQIRMDWAKFLEITNGRLVSLFLTHIPERFLPYSKEVIIEALEIVIKQFEKEGNQGAANITKATIPYLEWYVDDSEAIAIAAKNFVDKEYQKVFSKTNDGQEKQYKYIIENF
jgi:hypothetical protein